MRSLEAAVAAFRSQRGRAPIVLVDMDEVLCQWEVQFVASHRRLFPDAPIDEPGRRASFDLFAGLDATARLATAAVLNEPGFFADMLPVDGALDAVNDMRTAGVDLALCTSPWLSNPTCASDKLRWVERHLGAEMAEATIITRDKTRIRGDILIDDNPHVTGSTSPEWDLIRFTYHYNRHLPGARIDHWQNWRPTIIEALARLSRGDRVQSGTA